MSPFSKQQISLSVFLILLSVMFFSGDAFAKAAKKKPAGNDKYASIVVDANSGQVITETNADKVLYPASLTKMMTIYLALEAIETGKWSANTKLFVSQRAENQEPTKLGLTTGSRIDAMDAIKALIVKSANDIAVTVAENHSGSEYRFAQEMTRKAKALGMQNTVFKNASGLPDNGQVSSARDMSILAAAIMRDFPQYFQLFNLKSFTYKGVTHRSHNRLVGQYRGMDGMKTGYIRASGFNLVSTATRGDKRLIGVVFGGRSAQSRNDHMVALMDRGFATVQQGVYMVSNDNNKTLKVAGATAANISGGMKPPVPMEKPFAAQMVAALDTSIDTSADEEVLAVEEVFGQGSAEVRKVAYVTPTQKPGQTPTLQNAVLTEPAVADIADVASYSFAMDKQPVTSKSPSRYKQAGNWTIQVGAFNSRVKSDYAIRHAQSKVPHILDAALKRTVPAKDANGEWVFRARLTGLDRKAAMQACKHLDDCMVIDPTKK